MKTILFIICLAIAVAADYFGTYLALDWLHSLNTVVLLRDYAQVVVTCTTVCFILFMVLWGLVSSVFKWDV